MSIVNMKCCQCERLAMFMAGQFPLCLFCSNESKRASTENLNSLLGIMQGCSNQMAFQMGATQPYPPPKILTKGTTMNNINIVGSNIGMLNTGNINSKNINIFVENLMKSDQRELAEAIKNLIEEIGKTQQLDKANKEDVLELLSYIAEEAVKPSQDRKKSVIMSSLQKIKEITMAVDSIRKLFEFTYPLILTHFS